MTMIGKNSTLRPTPVAVVATLMLLLSACAQNDGYIGFWFGTWAIDSITIDGKEMTSWNDDGTWTNVSFQNNIANFCRNWESTETESHWCTWTTNDDDSKITFNFTHSDNANAPGEGTYSAPAWIYFEPGITTMDVQHSGKRMVWTTTHSSGQKVVYTLRKVF